MNKNIKVLFVDDSSIYRTKISSYLKKLDLIPIESKEPEEFYEKAESLCPDIYLVDLNIETPYDGLFIINELRHNMELDTPIIVISSESDSEQISEAIKIGADDYICKPIDFNLLASKLNGFLSTETIDNNVLPLYRLPSNEDSHSKFKLDCFIESIDEKGIIFQSNFSIKTNSSIHIFPSFLPLLQREEKIKLIIKKSWTDPSSKIRYFYGEYLEDDEMTQIKIRNHLGKI